MCFVGIVTQSNACSAFKSPSGVTVYCVTFKLRDSPEVCENVPCEAIQIEMPFALQIIFKPANQFIFVLNHERCC